MFEPRFSYSAISRRRKLELPHGAHVALWIALNLDYCDFNAPIVTASRDVAASPSPSGFGWYSYGMRVGLFRILDILVSNGIRASGLLNSDVCKHYPEVIEEGNKHDWAWLGHGQRIEATPLNFAGIDEERAYLKRMVETIERSTGRNVNGWLGPRLYESFDTPDLLAELGLTYVCDWVADDQPFSLKVKSGKLINIPYPIDGLNDARFADHALTGRDYYRLIVDQFDMLYKDGVSNPRIMCIAIHPQITGQPFRAINFDRALKHIVGHEKVWLTTGDEIAEWYYASYFDE